MRSDSVRTKITDVPYRGRETIQRFGIRVPQQPSRVLRKGFD
jgi:hypothetical protein